MSARAEAAPPLQEIAGPSALGGGARRFFHLTWLISVTEFRLGYLGTFLGYLWSLMRPLLMFGVLYVVFSQVFRFGDTIENYPVMLLFNIMLFTFFADATQRAVTAVVARENVVRKMQFPRMVIPLSVVLTAAFNMVLNLAAVFFFMLVYGIEPRMTWLLLPVILGALVVLTLATSMILSAAYVRFRDVEVMWGVIAMALLYGTPILYGVEFVPDGLEQVASWNPLAVILEQARVWIIDPTAPTAVDAAGGLDGLIPAALIFCGICAAGIWIFNREAPRIAEEL